jgi:hypothetical protein
MSRVRVTIDELALKGLEPVERKALVEGLQTELARMFADPAGRNGLRSNRTPVMRLGPVPIAPSASGGRQFGGELARTIGKKLKP